MRIILVNSGLFLFFLLSAPFLFLFLSMNIAVGGLITMVIVAFAVCFKIEGLSYTRLFKKFRNDGEPVFRCRNQSLVLGLNDDCIAQYPSGKDNLLAWLDGPEHWPLLTLSKKTRFFQWYQVERISMGLANKEVMFKLEGGQELKWLPENEDERTRLFNAIQTTSPSHLQLTERKSFKLVYSGLVWLVIPLIMIGLQVIGRGAGWMDKPNAQDLAGQVGKPDAFITMAFKATHFITQNLPEFLWIPTGILISALSSWLLWKIIRKDTNELVLTKPNPEQFNLTAANP
ncbi:MAG: hypothetical protein JHC56_11730 [Gemmataceae bacterium]|nr:hypothetical protein [Gemmataceae bacterium]MBJ7497894.1 hypothetical protein [Gemmataceae bacterium]